MSENTRNEFSDALQGIPRKEETGIYEISGKDMNNIIKNLYVTIIQDITPEERINKAMTTEILNLLKEEAAHLDRQTYEQCQEIAFRAASVAEESGFERGFLCALQLFTECIRC